MNARTWLLFAAVSVVWGVPYFFIKVAVDADVPPAFIAWSRVALGAALLLPLARRRGALRGPDGRWRPIAAYAACEIAVPFLLIALGEQHNPLVAVVLGVLVLDERVGASSVVGLLAILAGSWLSTGGRPPRLGRRAQAVAADGG